MKASEKIGQSKRSKVPPSAGFSLLSSWEDFERLCEDDFFFAFSFEEEEEVSASTLIDGGSSFI